MSTKRKIWKAFAVLFMLLFIAALGMRYWASAKTVDYLGPTHIASNNTVLFVHLNGDMIKLDAQGHMLDRYPPQQTGFDRPPIDLRVLSDGRLLYAEQQPARIRLCNTDTWQCEELGRGLVERLKRQYKVWVDEASNQLILTDAAGGGVWAQPLQGGEATAIVASTSCVANDLAITDQGRIWVADSGNHRIIELAQTTQSIQTQTPNVGEMKYVEISKEISTQHDLVQDNRDFPMMLAQDNQGNWWVTQPKASAGPHADVLVYHPDNGVIRRVELPQGVYALDITPMADNVIITDLDGYRLHKINTDTFEVSSFGDVHLKNLLQLTQRDHLRYDALSTHAMTLMVVFAILMITAATFATPKGKRWSQRPQPVVLQASESTLPPIHGVYWLKRNPKAEKVLQWGEPIFYIITIAFIVFLLATIPNLQGLDDESNSAQAQQMLALLQQMLLFLAGMFTFMPIIGHFAFSAAKRKLGTDGRNLFVKMANGEILHADPRDLVYTKTLLFYRQFSLPVQNGYQQSFYADDELQSYINPLLKRARKLNSWQLLKHWWFHRNGVSILQLFYLLSIAMGLLWFWLRIKGFL